MKASASSTTNSISYAERTRSAPTDHEASSTTEQQHPLTLSFSAGGWFMTYHFGVCQAILDSGLLKKHPEIRLCGSSAGSLAVAALAGELDFEEMKQFALECGDDCRLKWYHIFKMKHYLHASIRRFGDGPMRPEKIGKVLDRIRALRCEVYTTSLPSLKPRILNQWNSLSDVEEALTASCCFTPVLGLPFRLRKCNSWVIDGGLASFQPRAGEPNTITISPFYFTQADIHPTVAMPVWWGVRPPKRTEHQEMYDIGYNDALTFFIREELVDASAVELLRHIEPLPAPGLWGLLKDFLVGAVYCFFFRPVALYFIYLELFWMGVIAVVLAVLQRGTNQAARAMDHFRTVISLRNFLKLAVSAKIPVNETRLASCSYVYRFVSPWLYKNGKTTTATTPTTSPAAASAPSRSGRSKSTQTSSTGDVGSSELSSEPAHSSGLATTTNGISSTTAVHSNDGGDSPLPASAISTPESRKRRSAERCRREDKGSVRFDATTATSAVRSATTPSHLVAAAAMKAR